MMRLDSTATADALHDRSQFDDGREELRLGLRALAREEIEPALRHLGRAAALLPDSPDAHAYLGCALLSSGAATDAIEETETALRLAPDGFGPNLKGGELALRVGDPDLAERRFLVALRAVEPSSRDAAAARTLLSEARRRRARSIRREAFLPSLARLRLRSRTVRGDPGVSAARTGSATRTGEAGGTIA